MNYEDRTDLLPPNEVVSAAVLARLLLDQNTASRLMSEAMRAVESVAVSPAAYEAMARRVEEDTSADTGAPIEARAVEEDAMLCGYRFGRLVLGPMPRSPAISAQDLRERADAMYLYDLWDRPPDSREILERNGVGEQSVFEEAASWAWAFGLGVAVVETDLTATM